MPDRQVERDDYAALIRWITVRAADRHGLDADDLAQSAALKLARRGDRGRAYAARVARSVVADALAKRAYIARTERGAARPERADPPPVLSDVGEAVARLPAALREAVALTYWRGHDSYEVADVLGLHPSTVRNRLMQARRLLAVELADYRPE